MTTDATSALTGTAATTSAGKTTLGAKQLNGNFSEFLTLLTTQLQNQDPLNPMDSAQFTQQLVEYSQVEQQLNTNAKLDNLTTLSMNSALSLALGYVGKDITYTSPEMNFDGATPIDISYNLPTAASTATMNILDAEGNVVYSAPVSTISGTNKANWNGITNQGTTAIAGTYTINIAAIDSTGAPETVTTAVTGLVHGVENQDGVPNLLVGDRAVPLGSVINANTHTTQTASGS
jgi:flagellar basal-body rod modification protein FlgD